MVEYVKVSRSGKSLVISIPPPIRDAMRLAWKDQLRLSIVNGELLVSRIDPDEEARRHVSRGVKR